MRDSNTCFLILVLLLLICIFDSDIGRAFWPSGTTIHSVLLVKYHCIDHRLDSMEKLSQMNLEKEVSNYDGIISVDHAAFKHKNLIHTGRKLLMKHGGVSQEEVSKSNTSNNHTMNKRRRSHQRTRNMKRLKKKDHHRHNYEQGSVGAFTEDYRVPRPHPPRNN